MWWKRYLSGCGRLVVDGPLWRYPFLFSAFAFGGGDGFPFWGGEGAAQSLAGWLASWLHTQKPCPVLPVLGATEVGRGRR